MALLSKPSGQSGVRYFNPAWGCDAYLVTFSEGTLSEKDGKYNFYGKATIKGILETETQISLSAWSVPYKDKQYQDGNLTEVTVQPGDAEANLAELAKGLLDGKERVAIKGEVSIGLLGCQHTLEVSAAPASSKGGYSRSPSDFYQSTSKVLEARRDFYLSELNLLCKEIGIEVEVKTLTDTLKVLDAVSGDKPKQTLLGNYQALVKSFWTGKE